MALCVLAHSQQLDCRVVLLKGQEQGLGLSRLEETFGTWWMHKDRYLDLGLTW